MGLMPKITTFVKEERKGDCATIEDVEKIRRGKKTGGGGSFNSSFPNREDSTTNIQKHQLESIKGEMGEVREENQRLKALLARVVKDYHSLQMHLFDIVQHDQPKKETPPQEEREDVEEPHELISLSLGTSTSGEKKEEKTNITTKGKDNGEQKIEEGLTLALDCKFEGSSNENSNKMSPSISIEEANKEEEAGEPWPPSKILKNMRSGADADEVLQQTPVKKTRVSVRARCDAPTMHDGCQWRKYGQKIAKGNPCPRAYYRCTVAPACPVRKQVQRCAEDMSILITTYEGTHNHPLPISATAMASTTSAAACMLMSGSTASSSSVSISAPHIINPSTNINPHALSFCLPGPSSQLRPFFLPTPTISSTPSYPTITLDLTSSPQTTSQTSQFGTRFPSSYSTTFNFSSTDTHPRIPTAWHNGPCLGYGTQQASFNTSTISHQPYIHMVASPSPFGTASSTQHALTDAITKVIATDPSFQSVLAAAITSYVGRPNGAQIVLEGAKHSPLAPYSLLPTLAFSGSKSESASPLDIRGNIN